MKAWTLSGIGKLDFIDVPQPKIENGRDVLVEVKAVGVCGSDIHYYSEGRIGNQVVTYPFTIGHECSGTVKDVGSGARRFNVGDPVVVEPAFSCLACDQCSSGRLHTCRNLKFMGCPGQLGGCMAEFIVVPERNLYKVDSSISLTTAVMAEPLSIAIYAVKRSPLKSTDKILIMGAGPIGLCVMNVAGDKNVENIFITDKIDNRLDFASLNGAAWTGNPNTNDVVSDILSREPLGLDMVYECCGDRDALDQAVQLLKPGGTLVIVGIPGKNRVCFDIHEIRRKEIDIINIRRQLECMPAALDLIARSKTFYNSIITHKYTWDKAPEALATVANKKDNVIKALIVNE